MSACRDFLFGGRAETKERRERSAFLRVPKTFTAGQGKVGNSEETHRVLLSYRKINESNQELPGAEVLWWLQYGTWVWVIWAVNCEIYNLWYKGRVAWDMDQKTNKEGIWEGENRVNGMRAETVTEMIDISWDFVKKLIVCVHVLIKNKISVTDMAVIWVLLRKDGLSLNHDEDRSISQSVTGWIQTPDRAETAVYP